MDAYYLKLWWILWNIEGNRARNRLFLGGGNVSFNIILQFWQTPHWPPFSSSFFLVTSHRLWYFCWQSQILLMMKIWQQLLSAAPYVHFRLSCHSVPPALSQLHIPYSMKNRKNYSIMQQNSSQTYMSIILWPFHLAPFNTAFEKSCKNQSKESRMWLCHRADIWRGKRSANS